MKKRVLVRYHEIGLKGKNRPLFVRRLIRNIQRATRGLPLGPVREDGGQILLTLTEDTARAAVAEALGRVFGIANFAFAYRAPLDLEGMKRTIAVALESHPSFSSFRIRASRGDKSFPMTSVELNRELGAFVQTRSGSRVDLTSPDLTIHLDVRRRDAYVYFDVVQGPGGLPVGTGGRVVALMSGGIDSPVAAHRMMKRGCQVSLVHFHSFPLVDASSRDKAKELAERLNGYQFDSRLLLVPFADVQRSIIATVPPRYRVVVYRRFMVRIAEALARREGALALVTGESLGQVASQTLENIVTVDAVAQMPILRPLVGTDKREIIWEAERLGTYPISIQPDEDCCSLFVPKHPVTRCRPEEAARAEAALDVERLVELAIGETEIRTLGVPASV